jgi:hypothetical protein
MKEITFYTDDKNIDPIEFDDEQDFINLVASKYLKKEITITPMFSVPILHLKMSNWEFKKQILLNLFEDSQEWISTRDTVNTTYINEKEFKTNEKILEFEAWEKHIHETIYEILKEECKIIYETFGNPESYPNKTAEINYVWFQEQKKEMYHGPHSHGISGLSAVCFVEYDPIYHTPTRFLSPYLNPTKGYNEEYYDDTVSSGSLLVFPSNIIHYTSPNFSEKNRLILSFNINL